MNKRELNGSCCAPWATRGKMHLFKCTFDKNSVHCSSLPQCPLLHWIRHAALWLYRLDYQLSFELCPLFASFTALGGLVITWILIMFFPCNWVSAYLAWNVLNISTISEKATITGLSSLICSSRFFITTNHKPQWKCKAHEQTKNATANQKTQQQIQKHTILTHNRNSRPLLNILCLQ